MLIDIYFKSIIEQDKNQIVICDLSHKIIYMNPAAVKAYEKRGGALMIGSNLLDCHNAKSADYIQKTVQWFQESPDNNVVHTFFNEKKNTDFYMTALRNENGDLIGYYEKHECRTRDDTPFYKFLNDSNERNS